MYRSHGNCNPDGILLHTQLGDRERPLGGLHICSIQNQAEPPSRPNRMINYRLDKDGKRFKELTINGVTIGQYNEDTALETVLNDINSNTEAGVSVSFSKTTNQFVFTAKETGEGGRIDIGAGLGETLFGQIDYKDDGSTILGDTQKSSYTAGKDAIFHATINGKNMALSRSSNTFDRSSAPPPRRRSPSPPSAPERSGVLRSPPASARSSQIAPASRPRPGAGKALVFSCGKYSFHIQMPLNERGAGYTRSRS